MAKTHIQDGAVGKARIATIRRAVGDCICQVWSRLLHYGRSCSSSINHSRRVDCGALLVLMLVSLVFGIAYIRLRPDMSYLGGNFGYVLGESGNQLYRASRINEGALLYRDVACQYGALPVYLHAALARFLGTTITTNLIWHLSGSLLAIAMAYQVMRKFAGAAFSLVAMLLVGIPLLLAPGGNIGAYTNVEYLSIERCCMLGLLLLWRVPSRRTFANAILAGVALGTWQNVKFGGAVFAILAFFASDMIAWRKDRAQIFPGLRFWIRALIVLSLIQLSFTGICHLLLPPELAFDTIWPAYVASGYPGLNEAFRFPEVQNLLSAREITPLLCVASGLAVLAITAWNMRTCESALKINAEYLFVIAAALFYLLGAFAYLAHVHLFYQWLWVLIFPLALLVSWVSPLWRMLTSLLATFLPLIMVKIVFLNSTSPLLEQYLLPNGEVVYLSESERQIVRAIGHDRQRPSADAGDRFKVAVFGWSGGGIHFYFNKNYGLRNYLILPVVFRPYDERELLMELSNVSEIVVARKAAESPEEWLRKIFSTELANRIFLEFEASPMRSVDGTAFFDRKRAVNLRQE